MPILAAIQKFFIWIIFQYQTKILGALLSGLVITLTLESIIDIGKQYVSILGNFQTPIKAVLGLMSIAFGSHYLPALLMDYLTTLILYLGPLVSSGLILAGYSFAVGNAVTQWDYFNDGFKILYGISGVLIVIGLTQQVMTNQLPSQLPDLMNKTKYYPEQIQNSTNSSI